MTMEIISNSKTDLTSYFDKISTSWYKAAKSIIETGIYLNESKTNLSHRDWLQLCRELISRRIMSKTTISKIMTISKNQILLNDEYQKQLPSSYETLYLLSKQDEEVLESKINQHEITPETTQKELKSIFVINNLKTKDVKKNNKIQRIIIKGNIRNLPQDYLEELSTILDKLKRYGLDITNYTGDNK